MSRVRLGRVELNRVVVVAVVCCLVGVVLSLIITHWLSLSRREREKHHFITCEDPVLRRQTGSSLIMTSAYSGFLFCMPSSLGV